MKTFKIAFVVGVFTVLAQGLAFAGETNVTCPADTDNKVKAQVVTGTSGSESTVESANSGSATLQSGSGEKKK
jgi:hypothetical protein